MTSQKKQARKTYFNLMTLCLTMHKGHVGQERQELKEGHVEGRANTWYLPEKN